MSNTRRPRNPELNQPKRSTATAAVVGLVVAVCIAAVVVISVVLNNGGDGDTTASGGATSAAESTSETGATTGSPSGLDCTDAPAAPGEGEQTDTPPDASGAEDSTWVATVTTNCGDITMELFGDKAPQTVASFISLAEKGYYDDSPCHRLTTSGIFVLQCGDPTGTGSGGPGYGYGIENAPADGSYPRGTLAMARTSDPNSNGGQFFVVYKDSTLPTDGGGYSIFGTVTKGLDIIDQIADQGVADGSGDGSPTQPVSILGISVAKK